MNKVFQRHFRLFIFVMGALFWVTIGQMSWAHPGEDAQGGPSGPCDKKDKCKKPPNCKGVSEFNPYTGNSHRSVRDLEVWGGVGEHQLAFIRYHNSRIQQSGVIVNPQLGTAGQWRHEYQWEMFKSSPTDFTIFYPDGTRNIFSPVGNGEFTSTPAIGDRLFQDGDNFFLQRANGFRYRFKKPRGHIPFQAFSRLEDFRDSQQNVYALTYDRRKRLVRVSEPAGRSLRIAYQIVGGESVVSRVTTSDGRSASYLYDMSFI